MNKENEIKIAEKEFIGKADNLYKLLEYQERFFESFLKIKLSLISFVGVVIAIVFANRADFSENFLVILIVVSILSFVLLAFELLRTFVDRIGAIKKQYLRTILAKIRHIAMQKNLSNYGQCAEELLLQEDKIKQKMLNRVPLSEIVKYHGDKFYWPIFILWLLILISVPVLFLFEILGKL